MFHSKAGECIELSNGFKTASRVNPTQEFNSGVVFSLEPLKDDEIFEVSIDKKLHTWSGSVEIGVTVCNPDVIELPLTATDLRGGTWIMLGQGVLRDGKSLLEAYGSDLDKLVEGDHVGVMKTSKGELKFFVNGECQGIAATNLPAIVYAVVDLYGKCAQITVTTPSTPDSLPIDEDSSESIHEPVDNVEPVDPSIVVTPNELESYLNVLEQDNSSHDVWMDDAVPDIDKRPPLAPTASEETSITEPTGSGSALTNHVANISIANSYLSANDSNVFDEETTQTVVPSEAGPSTDLKRFEPPGHRTHRDQNNKNHIDNMAMYANISDSLRFHSKCGSFVTLSHGGRTAERKRPMDEFNNGVVMSHRSLAENELFQIRIDKLVSRWSGSIEVGISTHNPDILEFPATMTNMRSGTIMMSGTGILTNGKGTLREYGQFNLDELREGDLIGMVIRPGRNLHYIINGMEQGVAASSVPSPVWAVVDLYGMTVKVTIVDGTEQSVLGATAINQNISNGIEVSDIRKEEALVFHKTCGNYAEVINEGKTGHRPNAGDDFNNGVILTKRTLRPNERFEVRLDRLVDKWAGSLEIGVTTHKPSELDFPTTMTNIRSGTWLMTSSGLTHNGTTVIEGYGKNLDRLKVGECVGVVRKSNGSLHFYVNNQDQGVAATNVPEKVFGVIDLYGQAAQASIVDCLSQDVSAITIPSENTSTNCSDLRFHHLHGRNAYILRNGLTAQRPNANGEFNDAIVMSNRQLYDGEMFEVCIDQMVDRWSGSLEAGVTAIAPEQINFPSTMTDIDYETWMLSGSSVMRNGVTVMSNYACDLDSLDVGTRIGMMRHTDGSLHFYVNGQDQGSACENLPLGLWAVIELYGQCAQVSIVQNVGVSQSIPTPLYIDDPVFGTEIPPPIPMQVFPHQWSRCCGANVSLNCIQTEAVRIRLFHHSLLFSSCPLEPGELFEIRLKRICSTYAGCLRIGLTTLPISDTYQASSLPSTLHSFDSHDLWWIDGSMVRRNKSTILKLNYCTHLGRLEVGDRVGIKKTNDGNMKIYINGDDFGIAASNISKDRVFAVVELSGNAESVEIISVSHQTTSPADEAPVGVSIDSLELDTPVDKLDTRLVDELNGITNPEARLESIDDVTNHIGVFQFHENRGKNIQLSVDKTSAMRVESYDQGIVFSSKPLSVNTLFQVKMGALNPRWSNSLMVGITAKNPDKIHVPNSAFDLKKNSWVICGDSVFFNGTKIKGRYGPNLDSLSEGFGSHVIGLLVDEEHRLHLFINGVDQGVAAKEIPSRVYAIFDLYGQCQELIVKNANTDSNLSPVGESDGRRILKDNQNMYKQSNIHVTSPQINHNEVNELRRDRGGASNNEVKTKKVDTRVGESLIKNCEYQNLCSRFKSSIILPETYFCPDGKLCFCETCHKIRGGDLFHTKGNPPKQYAQPVGWCRFALVSHVGQNNESWHMAYHGTHSGYIRRTLDRKELLFANELDLGASLTNCHIKDDDSDGSVLCFSPSISYASRDPNFRVSFLDPLTNRKMAVKTVLQVAVEPGSYKVGPPSTPYVPEGSELSMENVEWVTKERGATHLLALLVKIELPEDVS